MTEAVIAHAQVSFYGNPLHCDEALCWMKHEVKHRRLEWTVDPYCTSGERWDTLNCSDTGSYIKHLYPNINGLATLDAFVLTRLRLNREF